MHENTKAESLNLVEDAVKTGLSDRKIRLIREKNCLGICSRGSCGSRLKQIAFEMHSLEGVRPEWRLVKAGSE